MWGLITGETLRGGGCSQVNMVCIAVCKLVGIREQMDLGVEGAGILTYVWYHEMLS